MNGIAVNIIMLLIKGIPEGLLTVLALHVFTRTKIRPKKYFLLGLIFIIVTYFVRFLPITLGVNSIISFIVLIIIFQFSYKGQLSKIFRTIASSAGIIIIIAGAEVLNMLLLTAIYGKTEAEALFNSSDALVKSIYTIPSTIFFAVLIFLGHLLLKVIEKRKKENGKTGKKTGG